MATAMVTPAMAVAALALSVDAGEHRARLQVHDDALVKQLVDDQDDAAHVLDQRLSFDAFSEDSVEAFVHAVEKHAQDQLIVVDVPNDKYCHVRVAPENRDIVIDGHNIIFEAIGASAAAATRTLL